MIKIDEAVVVEGKYDKIKISNIIDTVIVETNGFGIFKDKEKQQLIKYLALKKGIVLMTDSDSAGFKIRTFVKNIAGKDNVIDVYMPDIYGKEKRKESFSAEGKLGVEGIDSKIILEALQKSGVICRQNNKTDKREITHTDFFEDGISGGDNSKERRIALAKFLQLPERISSSSLLKIINSYMTYDEYKEAVNKLNINKL